MSVLLTHLFYFGSASVRFFEKKLIRFGMSLVRFGSKNAAQFEYYSYLLLMLIADITATVDEMTLTSLMSLTTVTSK